MSGIVNAMSRYDHRQHVLSDWLAELDPQFQLGEVGEDTNRITWCQLLIGTTGSSILARLGEDATWDDAKTAILSRLDASPPAASRALLLQTTDIPAETARLVRCHNPWLSEDVYFCPEDALPAFVTGVPALSSGSEVWIAIHNHRPEPFRLHSGKNIAIIEVVTVADTPSSTSKLGPMHQPPVPEHLSPLQQQQLNGLFKEFSNVFSQGEDDLGCTPLLEHTIETHGPPLRQP